LREARWIEARLAQLLPTHYFHVVFTLPAPLRPLVHANRRRLFSLLLRAASQTLLTLGRDPARLGVHLGITAVLHTWTRELQFHPHVHCLVTGGGLALEARRWVATRRRHLLPVRVLGRLFRGKFLAALTHAHARGHLTLPASLAAPHALSQLCRGLRRHEWIVYAKAPFAGPTQVFRYLGRYTHRVGLSNHRLRAVTPTTVRFATKHGREVTVTPDEFLRRFLLHVLPRGFVKIRHLALFAPGPTAAAARAQARTLLRAPALPPPAPREPWQALLQRLTGLDVTRCPRCAHQALRARPLPSPIAPGRERAPPAPCA
jgi:hypothetical protein